MPMLRLVSLDLCDASDGDFEIPDVSYRRAIFFLKKIPNYYQGLWQKFRHYATFIVQY